MANPFSTLWGSRKPMSTVRKNLIFINIESIPSIIVIQLMGGPFLTGYLIYLGASSQQIGFVLAVSALVNLIQIVMALVMQRIRNRRVMVIICFTFFRCLWVSAGLIPFFISPEWAIQVYTILFMMAFMCSAAGNVVWASLIGDLVPASVRGRYFGIRNTIIGAVGSIALYVGGQIMDRFPGGQGFQILFWLCVGIVIVNTVLMFKYPNAPFVPSVETDSLKMIHKPFRDRKYLKSVIFLSVYLFIMNISVPFFPYVMLKILDLSYSSVSLIIVVHTIAIMVSNYVWGNLNTLHSNQRLLFYTLPFLALSCLLWGTLMFLPTMLVLILIHVVLGIGLGGFNQIAFNYIIGDTPKTERPMYIAVFSAFTGFFIFLGPLIGGRIYDWAKNYAEWIQIYGISASVGFLLLVYGYFIGNRVLRNR